MQLCAMLATPRIVSEWVFDNWMADCWALFVDGGSLIVGGGIGRLPRAFVIQVLKKAWYTVQIGKCSYQIQLRRFPCPKVVQKQGVWKWKMENGEWKMENCKR